MEQQQFHRNSLDRSRCDLYITLYFWECEYVVILITRSVLRFYGFDHLFIFSYSEFLTASDLAGTTYGMNCLAKGVEDDDSNFTRFLLLGRKGVLEYLGKDVPSKTSVVFTLPNTAGALYKALACFSLRDIDFSKIESRPTSAALLNYLKFRKTQQTYENGDDSRGSGSDDDLPRFRYCFYLDFLDGQLSSNSENALSNLKEFTDFVRILGSYPRKSRLVGPVSVAAEEIKIRRQKDETEKVVDAVDGNADEANINSPLNIGLVGFGSFGQVLATRMIEENHRVSCLETSDKVRSANRLIASLFKSPFEWILICLNCI